MLNRRFRRVASEHTAPLYGLEPDAKLAARSTRCRAHASGQRALIVVQSRIVR